MCRANLAHRPREVLARDDERRRDAHDRAVGVLGQYPALEQAVDDRARGYSPSVDLDADEEPAPANIGHERAVDLAQLGH